MKRIVILFCILNTFLYSQDFYNVELEWTGESQLIIFQDVITSLEVGDEIGIFDSNGIVDSDGNTINHATDVYLEHTGGYLPHHRISITDGTGSFKVGALGMTSGDMFKVKIGFRSYTGLADVNYTVS